MIYKPQQDGSDEITVTLTDNHGGVSTASSNINIVTSHLGLSGMTFTADAGTPTGFSAQVSDTSTAGWAGQDVTVDLTATAGSLRIPEPGTINFFGLPIPGGIEIRGSLGQVGYELGQALYTPDGSSNSGGILIVAHDSHGGSANAYIPVIVNLPLGGGPMS